MSGGNADRSRKRDRGDRPESSVETSGGDDRSHRERLERAEARRQERRARAAAAREAEERRGQRKAPEANPSAGTPGIVSNGLRFVAYACLAVGFLGLTLSESWLTPADSPYGVVFGTGIVAALLSIYLAIYQHQAA